MGNKTLKFQRNDCRLTIVISHDIFRISCITPQRLCCFLARDYLLKVSILTLEPLEGITKLNIPPIAPYTQL